MVCYTKTMKRLGVYAFIGVMLVSMVGGFLAPEKSFAQTTQTQSQGSYDYFQGIVDALNSAAVTAINNTLQTTDPNASNYSTIQKSTEAFLTASQNNYNAYIQAFNNEKQNGTAPVDSQIIGIRAWIASMNSPSNLTLTRAYTGPQRTAYNQYALKMQDATTAALQIKSGNIAAGSAEAAVQTNAATITNAAAGNKNQVKQVMNVDPSKCKLLDFDLASCLDAFFAYIIKATLLQLAGFLVWLSANMLNLAIQIGILNFAQWSPDSLYPIWVIIRQIVSLFVVFAGLYLGFMYIIGREDTFEKYIPWIIIFALFVNFSYPLTRVLIDVSNVVSLNIYSSAVGGGTLAGTDPNNTAGALIMNRLGLQGLVMSATSVKDGVAGFVGGINSTPGALAAVAFVFYAAYIFFKATWIIVSRTAILVFLIVGSPILFVDSVIPALGERAAKLRTMYFEQLMVAPVFMIMLALTLKFLEVFQTSGALGATNNTLGALASGSGQSIQTFFNILMMLIMLHITIKVTENMAGSAGNYLGGLMGKVGGFGLGVATGGAGLLARGSIGMAAARFRDSKILDTWQGSRTGRGLYSLANTMATSTYDVRNVGMVSSGMKKAGMGMGAGAKGGYDTDFKKKSEALKNKYGSIRDADAREKYLAQKSNDLVSKAQKVITYGTPLLGENEKGEQERVSDTELIARNIRKGEDDSVKKYNQIKDEDKKREYLESLPKNVQERIRNAPKEVEEPATQKPSASAGQMAFAKMANDLTKEEKTEETPKAAEGSKKESVDKNTETPAVERKLGDDFNVHTEDIATKLAKRRADRLKTATISAEKNMADNANKKGDEPYGTPAILTPSPSKPSPSGAEKPISV